MTHPFFVHSAGVLLGVLTSVPNLLGVLRQKQTSLTNGWGMFVFHSMEGFEPRALGKAPGAPCNPRRPARRRANPSFSAMKETSFVYHDKRGFFLHFGQILSKYGQIGARFLRFRGKIAGVLLFVLYACKGLRKGSSRWDLNRPAGKSSCSVTHS